MARKSTPTQYGSVAVTIHWLAALAILALLGSGFRAANTIDPAAKAQILSIHAPLGIFILLLTLFRLVWWWRYDTKPLPSEDDPKWQTNAAKAVHVLLYIVMLGMAASGIGMFALSGAGAIVFGGVAAPLPDFTEYPPRIPHGLGARLMVLLLAAHIGAALYHHFIKRDATLRRMWFG